MQSSIGFQLCARRRKQWADYPPALNRNTRESIQTGSTQETKQHGFCLVIGMMRRGNAIRASRVCRQLEKRVSCSAGIGFASKFLPRATGLQRNCPRTAKTRNPIRIRTTVVAHRVIEVRGANSDTEQAG